MNNIEKDTDRNVEDIRDLHTKINEFGKEMLKRMDALDDSFDTKMKSQAETATKQHNEIQTNVERKIDLLGDRLRVLEQWKYFVIGAAAVIGYLVKYLMG